MVVVQNRFLGHLPDLPEFKRPGKEAADMWNKHPKWLLASKVWGLKCLCKIKELYFFF